MTTRAFGGCRDSSSAAEQLARQWGESCFVSPGFGTCACPDRPGAARWPSLSGSSPSARRIASASRAAARTLASGAPPTRARTTARASRRTPQATTTVCAHRPRCQPASSCIDRARPGGVRAATEPPATPAHLAPVAPAPAAHARWQGAACRTAPSQGSAFFPPLPTPPMDFAASAFCSFRENLPAVRFENRTKNSREGSRPRSVTSRT